MKVTLVKHQKHVALLFYAFSGCCYDCDTSVQSKMSCGMKVELIDGRGQTFNCQTPKLITFNLNLDSYRFTTKKVLYSKFQFNLWVLEVRSSFISVVCFLIVGYPDLK